ncbi:unnamed protein product [Rhodiola kirilowii]
MNIFSRYFRPGGNTCMKKINQDGLRDPVNIYYKIAEDHLRVQASREVKESKLETKLQLAMYPLRESSLA